MNKFEIQLADRSHLPAISKLYEKYLDFYQVDITGKNPQDYLEQRLINNESYIFYAVTETGEYAGFAQLYPLFCSLEMKRAWLLYDLYVDDQYRKMGVGKQLLQRAEIFAKEKDSAYIMLSTATDNFRAQSLYEKSGYEKDTEFLTYLNHLKP